MRKLFFIFIAFFCPLSVFGQTETNSDHTIADISPIDEYSKLSFSDENARLDNGIRQFKDFQNEYQNSLLALIVYSPNNKQFLLKKNRISKYLISKGKLSSKNFRFINGGVSDLRIIMYVIAEEHYPSLKGGYAPLNK